MKYLFLLSCSLVAASPAAAQGARPTEAAVAEVCDESGQDCGVIGGYRTLPDAQITVLGSGRWDRIEETGQPISVITAAEIAAVQGPDLTRVLERLPGVTLARSGGLGSQTSLFVRGGSSDQVLVLIDGVRVADVAAPSGGFDLGTLLPAGVAKIELLRGANSVAWGSDALAGVLAVTTAAPDGVTASVEYGAHDSLSSAASGGVSGEGYQIGVDGGYTRSDGISAYAPGTEADPFRQWHLGARGRAELAPDLALVATGRYADSKVDFDGYPAPLYAFADTGEYQITRQLSGRAGFDYTGGVALAGGLAYARTERDYFDPTFGSDPNYTTRGRSLRADFAGRADLADALRLTFGADSEWTRFSSLFDPERSARLSSAHALLGYQVGALSLSAGARIDDHDRFGTHWTFGGNGSLDLGADWRLRASYGEGFKAPTLYQLYGFGGNDDLQPEQSRSYDLGVEHGNRNAALHFAATLFRRDSRQLISYLWPDGYFNTARARAQGFELEAAAAVTAAFRVRAAYTYVEAVNRATGSQLARRPRHALSTSADWTTPLAGLALGADLRLVSDSFDDPGNFVPIDGHALVTLRASVPLGEHLELYGRVENLTDAAYETVAGYGTYGRSAYAGVRVKW